MPRISGALSHARRLAGGDEDPGLLEVTTARAPKTSFNGPVSPHRRFAFGSLSLDSVKRLKNELGITVNDVVVALCATAVRDWLLDRDELPKEPLVAMIPVSVRTEEQAGTFGNRISTMIVPIPTNVKDPRKRLHARARVPAQRQGAPQGAARRPADRRDELHPARGGGARRAHDDGHPRPHAAAAQPRDLQRARARATRSTARARELQAHFPVSVVIDGVGLNMTVMSYRDHVDFGIIADRDQIDDAWALMDGTAAALDELETAICGKRPATANGRRPAAHDDPLGEPADAAVVVARERHGAGGDQERGAGDDQRERGVAVGADLADDRRGRGLRGGDGRSCRGPGLDRRSVVLAGMARAEPGATARAAVAQASVSGRASVGGQHEDLLAAPLQRGWIGIRAAGMVRGSGVMSKLRPPPPR